MADSADDRYGNLAEVQKTPGRLLFDIYQIDISIFGNILSWDCDPAKRLE